MEKTTPGWKGHPYPRGGAGGGMMRSHIKVTVMLVVLLRGVNRRFWSPLGCLGRKATKFAHSGIA